MLFIVWESEALLQFSCHVPDQVTEFWLEGWVYFVIYFNPEAILRFISNYLLNSFLVYFLQVLGKKITSCFRKSYLLTRTVYLCCSDNAFKNSLNYSLEFYIISPYFTNISWQCLFKTYLETWSIKILLFTSMTCFPKIFLFLFCRLDK